MRSAVLSDDFAYLCLLKQDLERAGHIVATHALVGDDVLPWLEEYRPHFLVACLRSTELGPEWDAFSRLAQSLAGDVPLIICSSEDEICFRHLSLHLLHATPLCAPYTDEQLLEKVSEALDSRSQRLAWAGSVLPSFAQP